MLFYQPDSCPDIARHTLLSYIPGKLPDEAFAVGGSSTIDLASTEMMALARTEMRDRTDILTYTKRESGSKDSR